MGRLTRSAGLGQGVAVGVLATVSMDLVFLAASKVGGERFTSDKIGLDLVGRSAAGLLRGRVTHTDIVAESVVPGEAAVGLAVHYLTGIALTEVYYLLMRGPDRQPGLTSASAFGATTALLPLLVMYPSWGIGPFGLRSGESARLVRLMLLGHTAFGAGIGLWTTLLRQVASRTEMPTT